MSTHNTTYGIVYVLTNPAMPDLIKIGMTSRDSVDGRLKELFTTSVPVPFECEYACKVSNYVEVERALHLAFDHTRVHPQREFFRLKPEQVIVLLRLFEKANVTQEVNREMGNDLTDTDRVAGETLKSVRRPPLNFVELGIPIGATLQFTQDETGTTTVEVCAEKKVSYRGATSSLTAITRELLGFEYTVQPSPYWTYRGRRLLEIYNETYVVGE